MVAATREAVLAIFETHRATPGAAFDEAHFLDFLIRDPASRGAVRNSFGGLRRYNAFLEAVQLAFHVCFSVKDFEGSPALDAFLQRVNELQRAPKRSIAALREQQRRGFGWGTVFVLNVVLLLAVTAAWRWLPAAGMVLGVILLLANAAVLRFYLRWRAYRTHLLAQLEAVAGAPA